MLSDMAALLAALSAEKIPNRSMVRSSHRKICASEMALPMVTKSTDQTEDKRCLKLALRFEPGPSQGHLSSSSTGADSTQPEKQYTSHLASAVENI